MLANSLPQMERDLLQYTVFRDVKPIKKKIKKLFSKLPLNKIWKKSLTSIAIEGIKIIAQNVYSQLATNAHYGSFNYRVQ